MARHDTEPLARKLSLTVRTFEKRAKKKQNPPKKAKKKQTNETKPIKLGCRFLDQSVESLRRDGYRLLSHFRIQSPIKSKYLASFYPAFGLRVAARHSHTHTHTHTLISLFDSRETLCKKTRVLAWKGFFLENKKRKERTKHGHEGHAILNGPYPPPVRWNAALRRRRVGRVVRVLDDVQHRRVDADAQGADARPPRRQSLSAAHREEVVRIVARLQTRIL